MGFLFLFVFFIQVEKANRHLEMAGLELGMRPEIYFRSYSVCFTQGLLCTSEDSGPRIHVDFKTGNYFAYGVDNLVIRL